MLRDKVSNDNLLLYAGAKGVTAYSISENKELWVGSKATGICVSADGTRAACVYKDASEAVVYDAKTGKDLEGVEFTLYEAIRNPDGTFSPGKVILNKNGEKVRYITDSQGRIIVYGNSFKDGWVLELGKAYALVETGFLSGYNQNVQPIYFILGNEADGINTYKPYDVIEVQNSKEENTEDKKEELKNVPATGDEITTLIGIAILSMLMILAIEKSKRKLA